jgi:hypothetical protein
MNKYLILNKFLIITTGLFFLYTTIFEAGLYQKRTGAIAFSIMTIVYIVTYWKSDLLITKQKLNIKNLYNPVLIISAMVGMVITYLLVKNFIK